MLNSTQGMQTSQRILPVWRVEVSGDPDPCGESSFSQPVSTLFIHLIYFPVAGETGWNFFSALRSFICHTLRYSLVPRFASEQALGFALELHKPCREKQMERDCCVSDCVTWH